MPYRRASGILLHPTSLPGGAIGTFGVSARQFVDFLQLAGQSLWQVLPLGPTGFGNSPYACYSAFAGSPLLIDLPTLVAEGDLPATALPRLPDSGWVDYERLGPAVDKALEQAARTFLAAPVTPRTQEFWHFCDSTFWLHDYALFMALREQFPGKLWRDWPSDIARRQPAALEKWSVALGAQIGVQKYIQWQFQRQWQALHAYARQRGVAVVGDLPIFVAYDSADVWCNPFLFQLDERCKPTAVAGVPPDYFSRTGQLWGNPLYAWERHAAQGYNWWLARFQHELTRFDLVRLDHFRGFAGYWAVPARHRTAMKGSWQPGPGAALFQALLALRGDLPLLAEDLGVITPDVDALRQQFALPGMRILQFAFAGGPDNPYLPHNHTRQSVVYTGTHDNDTTVGWFSSLGEAERAVVLDYLGSDGSDIAWELLRAGMASVAERAIFPLQDILCLDNTARMNLPGSVGGNWSWHCPPDRLTLQLAERLRRETARFGRLAPVVTTS